MNDSTLKELRQLVDEVVNAPTKQDAKSPLKHLEYKVSTLSEVIKAINPSMFVKLGEVIISAKNASGKVKDKELLKSFVANDWYAFESGVKCGDKQSDDVP